nr:hypothetical protein [uncultured Sphingomonas sp.]
MTKLGVSAIDPLQTLRGVVTMCAMRWPPIFVAFAFLCLPGCSADYPLKAFFEGGKLLFDGAKKHWYFGRTGSCPKYFSVQTESGETVWRIESAQYVSDCKLFPVAYGVVPKGWETVVPVKPLKSGELYVLKGRGSDSYHGAFRYRERKVISVENEPELASQFPNPPYEWNEATQ